MEEAAAVVCSRNVYRLIGNSGPRKPLLREVIKKSGLLTSSLSGVSRRAL